MLSNQRRNIISKLQSILKDKHPRLSFLKSSSASNGQLGGWLALIVGVVRIPKKFYFEKKCQRAEPVIKAHLEILLPRYTFI